MFTQISRQLLDWYQIHARNLPWRKEESAPYAVLVSEIMLQQTRVETVIPYYQRWMERFPTLESLAQASLEEVLRYWEGLGYYSRAKNLHRTAQILVQTYRGEFPQHVEHLRKLPGIGDYTAAAIASIAFGQKVAAIDGNVRRVLSRLFLISEPLSLPETQKKLKSLAVQCLPAERAGDYNQAIMDLGALICLPRSPKCLQCPLSVLCRAYQNNQQNDIPVKAKKKSLPSVIVTAAIIRKGDTVLLAKRPLGSLLGGLWEFPGGKVEHDERLPECLKREILEELGVRIEVGNHFGTYHHAYTHFKVTLHAFEAIIQDSQIPHPIEAEEIRWIPIHSLDKFPMGKIDRLIARELVERKDGHGKFMV